MKVSLFSVHKNNKDKAKRKPAGKRNLFLTFLSRFCCFFYSTVTLFARFLGLSTSFPLATEK